MAVSGWSRLFIVCGMALCQGALFAQAPGTGAMRGAVLDPNGHPVANATVAIENNATHMRRTVLTNASGEYNAALLLPGDYAATAKMTGFADAKAAAVAVVASEISVVDF